MDISRFGFCIPHKSQQERQIHGLLRRNSPRLEGYSVDEGFCNCRGMELFIHYGEFGRMIRAHILQCTGLTVGCGLAPKKC